MAEIRLKICRAIPQTRIRGTILFCVGTVIAGVALALFAAIYFGFDSYFFGRYRVSYFMIAYLALGGIIVYGVILLYIRGIAKEYTIVFGDDAISIVSASPLMVFSWREIQRFYIRNVSDYARISIVTPAGKYTLYVGLAIMPKTAHILESMEALSRYFEKHGFREERGDRAQDEIFHYHALDKNGWNMPNP